MKKKIFFLAFAAITVFGMNAQLSVLKSGNVRIGTAAFNVKPKEKAIGDIGISNIFTVDSLATLNLLGSSQNKSGAYITFGNEKFVGIGEFKAPNSNADTDILSLFWEKGIQYAAGTKTVFSYNGQVSTSPFVFNCDIKANSFLVASDARVKDNISSLGGFYSSLAEISPVSYSLTSSAEAVKASAKSDSDACDTPMEPDSRTRFGFIAQEVKEVLPELVVEDENGYLSVDYLGFIPILVDAYKNLESRVKEQDEIIASLSGKKAPRKNSSASVDNILDGRATLLQNRPNPFKESTSVSCIVPEDSGEAFICIYDLQGKQVKHIDIEQRGNCSVTIDGSSLQPSMYIYSLIIDGDEIDSKKMILTD